MGLCSEQPATPIPKSHRRGRGFNVRRGRTVEEEVPILVRMVELSTPKDMGSGRNLLELERYTIPVLLMLNSLWEIYDFTARAEENFHGPPAGIGGRTIGFGRRGAKDWFCILTNPSADRRMLQEAVDPRVRDKCL